MLVNRLCGHRARSNKVVYGYKVWYGRVIRFVIVGWVRSYQSAHPKDSTMKILCQSAKQVQSQVKYGSLGLKGLVWQVYKVSYGRSRVTSNQSAHPRGAGLQGTLFFFRGQNRPGLNLLFVKKAHAMIFCTRILAENLIKTGRYHDK